MYQFARFTLSDMTRCGIELRKLGAGAASMEEVAQRIVRYLHESLRVSDGDRAACALVRFFVTAPYSELDPELQDFARGMLSDAPSSQTLKCLTLLATAGELPAWNSRHSSAGHKALPLQSAESIARSPMIAQLIRQFGIEVRSLLAPDPGFVVDAEQHTFNVFHVADAAGSPYIPAQREFVIPHGIRSVLGFGGLLPSGELFAIILFSRESIPRQTAELFKTLALNAKVAILPFVGRSLFA
jgi:hypothetical protein